MTAMLLRCLPSSPPAVSDAAHALPAPGWLPGAAPTGASSIRNFMRVTPDFCTGGQPRLEHFAQPQGGGDQGGAEPADAGRASRRRGAGGGREGRPQVLQHPGRVQQADRRRRSTSSCASPTIPANRPMFIHCTAAIRVGAFWMIRRVLRDGFTPEAALEEARKVGLVPTPHLEEFARDYIDSHKGKPPAPAGTGR